MVASPQRPSSPVSRPVPVVVPQPAHKLQISPNLEALLEHDELTRRNSGSPTSLHHTTSQLPPSEYAVSLPPPPRSAQGNRRMPQRDQDAASITRGRELPRKRSTNIQADFWSDALSPPGTDGQSVSNVSSRSVTPNPYINPAPVLPPINVPELALFDHLLTPKADEKPLPNEPKASTSQCASLNRPRSSTPDVSNTFHKMEKILWMGRDSLNLFGNSNGVKRQESDRRSAQSEHVDPLVNHGAVQDKHIRQVPVAPNEDVPQVSRYGDGDTATVLSPRSGSSYLYSLQPGQYFKSSQASPTRSSIAFEPTHPYDDKGSIRTYAASSSPRLSLPSISMSSPPPRLQSLDSNASHDYLSFIDFLSPSMPDDPNYPCFQGNSHEKSSPRQRLQSLTVSSDSYTTSHGNHSSTSLASMQFAPPSPISAAMELPSPVDHRSDVSSSSAGLSTIVFAPPSPSSTHLAPPHLRPVSVPPSPNSPLEFAAPSSPLELYGILPRPAFHDISERGRKQKSEKRSVSASPHPFHHSRPLPPTTNVLDANERAERIRRNRKLARLLGIAPGAEENDAEVEQRPVKKLPPSSLATLLSSGKPKSHRHAVSVSASVKCPGMKTEPSSPWQNDGLWSPGGRRHSTPLTPSSFTFFADGEDESKVSQDHKDSRRTKVTSPTSFMDLSDEETHDDDISCVGFLPAPHQRRHRRLHQSSSTPSLVESLDTVAEAELDRRRRREKLARLHRFLGSRVPMEAVTGGLVGPPLPPVASPPLPPEHIRDARLRRYKTAVDITLPEFDRGKWELDEKEKALNVRRAQKMEKVFGAPPPQTLYHTRASRPSLPQSQPTSPTAHNPYVLTLDLPSASRNRNQSAYKGKTTHSTGPSDSAMNLLPSKDGNTPESPVSFAHSFASSFADSLARHEEALRQSPNYLSYQHSLNSLVDIIDRDDRESLVELHRFLHGDVEESTPEEEIAVIPRRVSNASSLKSERRHSLPSSRASVTSLSSELLATPVPTQFQLRRRRAAKLTSFFGVDYRELIHDILESIEKGVEEDRNRGTLQPQEVEVLLHRVRSLRSLENQFS